MLRGTSDRSATVSRICFTRILSRPCTFSEWFVYTQQRRRWNDKWLMRTKCDLDARANNVASEIKGKGNPELLHLFSDCYFFPLFVSLPLVLSLLSGVFGLFILAWNARERFPSYIFEHTHTHSLTNKSKHAGDLLGFRVFLSRARWAFLPLSISPFLSLSSFEMVIHRPPERSRATWNDENKLNG